MRSENVKVLMIVENLSVPADPRVWREAQTLQQAGCQVCIISPQGEKHDQEHYVCIDGIHIYRYKPCQNIRRPYDYIREYVIALQQTLRLSQIIWKKHGFDVIHVANPPDIFFILGAYYRLFGTRFIFDQHDLTPAMFRAKFGKRMKPIYWMLKFFEFCSYRMADLIITTNQSQKQNAIKRGRIKPSKVHIVRNGPDSTYYPSHFSPPEKIPGWIRDKKYLLAYIGVMGTQDGVDYALRALHELVYQRGRRDTGLLLIGDGEQKNVLIKLSQELGLEQYVYFTGWLQRSAMLRHLHICDIGISPDPCNELNEQSTMLKTLEYMAMGKPIVAFDLTETRYSAQKAALYAHSNRIDDFADKIEILLAHETLRTQMGIYGRRRIEQQLGWQKTRQNLLLAYRWLFPDKGFLPLPSFQMSSLCLLSNMQDLRNRNAIKPC